MREMKDSGVHWIGEIPNNWSVCRVKDVTCVERGGSPRPIDDYLTENVNGYNWIKIGDTTKGSKYITETKQRIIEEGLSKTRYVEKGTLLLTNSMSFGEAYILNTDGCIHDGWLAFSKYKDISKEFLYYFFVSPFSELQFKQQVAGGVVQNLNIEKVKTTIILLPSLEEQNRIVDYLDNKCSGIDSIIAKQEEIIEKLKEYKFSMISEVVTKGLNLNAEMKESGIEWIGKIPSTWSVQPLFTLYKEGKKRNREGNEKNLLSLSYGKIIRKDIKSNDGLLPENFNGYNIVEVDDIIIRPTDLQNDKRSLRTGLVREHGIITSAYIDLQPKGKVNSEYFHFLLHVYDMKKVFYNMGNGVRQGLNYSEFSKLRVIVPSEDEMNHIVRFLEQKISCIDKLIQDEEEKINKLRLYKKSLIYEVVTGKKEV